MSKDHNEMKYFWQLDSELPRDLIHEYRQALQGKDATALGRYVALLENRVPLPPHAYLTSSLLKSAADRPASDFFAELGIIIERFEKLAHARLGSAERPLLLTVQGDLSGTVRNIGACPSSLSGLIHQLGAKVALPLYVDFIESFSSMVLRCQHIDFRKTFNISYDREKEIDGVEKLGEPEFRKRIKEYQNLVSQKIGKPFPEQPEKQLMLTVLHAARMAKSTGDEVFLKVQYHRSQFGHSVNGVAYTRNPFTGKRDLYGVYQAGADGKKHLLEPEAATDTAKVPAKPAGKGSAKAAPVVEEPTSLKDKHPGAYGLLKRFLPKIEESYHDVMEVEFVSDEDGHLYFTHFDKAQTTARATIVSTIELNAEGKIGDREAAMRIKPADVELLLHPTLDDKSRAKLDDVGSTGITAAPGTAVGKVFFKMADAMEYYQANSSGKKSEKVILIADELLISDTPGLGIISGLVTRASGIASHAAVMARANGIPCIVGYKGLELDLKKNQARVGDVTIKAGTVITLEAGSEGRLYLGEGTLQNLSFREGVIKDLSNLISRVIKHQQIPFEVRVNINNAKDADVGRSFGADGVGLCRTENMFMEAKSLREIRNIVFTRDPAKCKASFKVLEEIQYEDFRKIFQVMGGRVVNIRLMDMPLHDFAPQTEADFNKIAAQLKHLDKAHLRAVAEELKEHNPMLGLRACRFGIITPEIYDMQIRAIVRAAYAVAQEKAAVDPGIMFPLVFTEAELIRLKGRVHEIEEAIREELKVPFSGKIKFRVGSMIELPAAALSADTLSRVGEFFAFGTNDLTQTTLGMSRDDSAHYLPMYLEKGILPADPFKVLAEPVRELVETAVKRGRRTRQDASFGICGEQGGDPSSLLFCLERGLNYVSCSPFRVLPSRVALIRVALNAGFSSEREETAATQAKAA